MADTTTNASLPRSLQVFVDDATSQPSGSEPFTLCPLGLQFYSAKPLAEFDLMQFDVDVPPSATEPAERISCTGAVVRCAKVRDERYRIWIKFIDLPERARTRIHCASKDGQTLCSYCENY